MTFEIYTKKEILIAFVTLKTSDLSLLRIFDPLKS